MIVDAGLTLAVQLATNTLASLLCNQERPECRQSHLEESKYLARGAHASFLRRPNDNPLSF